MRCFENDDVIHVAGRIDPLHDIEIIDTELMLADLDTVQKGYQRAERNAKTNEKAAVARREALKKLLDALENGQARAQRRARPSKRGATLRDLHLITAKPVMYVANVAEGEIAKTTHSSHQCETRGRARRRGRRHLGRDRGRARAAAGGRAQRVPRSLGLEEPGLNRVIRSAYRLLGLKTFYTAGPKEVRAWTVKRNATAPEAAGAIHTDFERGFIRAEVIGYDQYIARRGEHGARDAGELRLEGKTYVVQEGDVVHFGSTYEGNRMNGTADSRRSFSPPS